MSESRSMTVGGYFWPLIFFINRSHMDPGVIPWTLFEFGIKSAEILINNMNQQCLRQKDSNSILVELNCAAFDSLLINIFIIKICLKILFPVKGTVSFNYNVLNQRIIICINTLPSIIFTEMCIATSVLCVVWDTADA